MNIKKVNAGVWVKALDDIFPTESGVITMRTDNMGVWTQYINIGQVDKEYWKKTNIEWLKPVEGYVLTEQELQEYKDDINELEQENLRLSIELEKAKEELSSYPNNMSSEDYKKYLSKIKYK